jgi:tRNA-2-methylthio-N6-dimethylallyladenosine synthase
VNDGAREITLLGQNVNSYNSDITFAELLEKIAGIDGDFIIRFMTSHPKDVSDSLIDVLARYSGKIAPYFHLPLQSGSDKILRLMNRTYDSERFLTVVKKLRAAVPNIAISTDIIIGFPGEEDVDFADTKRILSEVRFDMAYIFNYSEREGTRASKMENKVFPEIKDRRMSELLSLQSGISYEKNLLYVGKTLRVLVDSVSADAECVYTARTDTNKLVHFTSENDCIGKFKFVKIIRAGESCLYGEEIKENTK